MRLQILREGATLATVGLVLGLMGSYVLGRTMQSMLFGMGALNLPVILATSLVLLGTALAACYVPARRASAVDPLIALRQSWASSHRTSERLRRRLQLPPPFCTMK